MIAFPRPEAFVQSLRQRRRAMDANAPLIVVEGMSDKRALLPFLDGRAVVIPADGKEFAIIAFDRLEPALKERILFIIDCDGTVDVRLKGQRGLVLTTNRDIEADLLFELDAFARAAHEFLAPIADSADEIERLRAELLDSASQLGSVVGLVTTSAREVGAPTRLIDARSGRRRKLRLRDLSSVQRWLQSGAVPSIGDAVTELARTLGWDASVEAAVNVAALARSKELCHRHSDAPCFACGRMTHCNGHYLVEALSIVLKARHGVKVSQSDVDRALRIAADRSRLGSWDMAIRIRAWEIATSCQALA